MTTGPGDVFVTGATGFLGLEVVRGLIRRGIRPIVFGRGASPGASELAREEKAGRVRFVRGDLVRSDLGVDRATHAELARTVTTIVHAAALYRLSAGRDAALAVNVDGLGHLLDHAKSWPLEQFHHVSSITVAGDTSERVSERMLDRPVAFRNFYEESKWLAESLLANRLHVPLRIYRPGIIVGHSLTGEIQKLDGPYASFPLMRSWLPFPLPGRCSHPFPLVNVDLAAEAIVAGVEHPPEGVEVLHVLDLDPLTAREFFAAVRERLTGRSGVLPLPDPIVYPLMRAAYACRLSQVEPEACVYPAARWSFDTEAFGAFCTRRGIPARRLKGSLDAIVRHYVQHTKRRRAVS